MKSLITRVPLLALAVTALLAPSAAASGGGHHDGRKGLQKIRHFVVIYPGEPFVRQPLWRLGAG